MDQHQRETDREKKRLEETLEIAKEQLARSRKAAQEKKEGIAEAKKDVFENSVHSFTNLYSSEDFEALVELSQLNNPVEEGIVSYEEELQKIHRLEQLIKSPYFARIDFQFQGEETAEPIYIGRSSLRKKTAGEIYVYDWRSPIAGVFYRFMTGAAYYDAPNGRIEGNVSLKRQYEIKDEKLQYFFDSDRNISDEFLRQLLSQNTSPKMKAVVETIQKEQDAVIRDMSSELLMVQGIAGSGKTSIALHRAAYLMYEGLQARLSAENIMIISPNGAFEQYISEVLPELGEKNVNSLVFDDIVEKLLRGRSFQRKHEFLEHAVTNNRYKKTVKSSMAFKMSGEFQGILDQLLLEAPRYFLNFEDIFYHGECVLTKEELRAFVMKRPDVALSVRFHQLEEYVLEHIFGTAKKKSEGQERSGIRERIQALCRLDIPELYQSLFITERGKSLLQGARDKAGQLSEILTYTKDNLFSGRLYYDDAIACAYLYLKFYGTGGYPTIRQVVIDEAQDYYPLQYEMFRMLFPGAKFTVLGDIHQTLGKTEDLSLYDRIRDILAKRTSSLLTLNKSFRCTNEILTFSRQFLTRDMEVESFNRKGKEPVIFGADTREELLEAIRREVLKCREEGLKTICLLCKTQKNGERLYRDLASRMEVTLTKGCDAESLKGAFIMPVYLAKGLEFDGVIVCDGDDGNYCDEDDRNLLYVECTRALHRLSLMYEGKRSRLF